MSLFTPQTRGNDPQRAGFDGQRLRVDWIRCDGRGLCAELLPEMVRLDEWGYPIVEDEDLPYDLEPHARQAVAACPTLALRLEAHRR